MWVKSRVESIFTLLNFIYHCGYVWERCACGNMCHSIHVEVQGQPEESALSFALSVSSRACTASVITCWSVLMALWCLFLTLPSSIRRLVMGILGSILVVYVLFLLLCFWSITWSQVMMSTVLFFLPLITLATMGVFFQSIWILWLFSNSVKYHWNFGRNFIDCGS